MQAEPQPHEFDYYVKLYEGMHSAPSNPRPMQFQGRNVDAYYTNQQSQNSSGVRSSATSGTSATSSASSASMISRDASANQSYNDFRNTNVFEQKQNER